MKIDEKAIKYQEALSLLQERTQRSPELYPAYLTMADIYEFNLHDKSLAAQALKKAIDIRSQPEWEARLKKLEK